MKTSILVSQPKVVYHPEDVVSGNIHLTATSGSTVKKISIDLGGTATTIAGGVSPYNENVVLLVENQVLYEGPGVVVSGEHQWPFEITIPRTCQAHQSQVPFSKKDTFFYGSASQSLPPAFQEIANLRLLSSVNRTGDESATIAYYLKANIFTGQDDTKPETVTIPLNIQPRRELEHPTWDTTTHVCKFSIPLNGRRRSSLTNIFVHRKPDNQDAVEFSLRARMATTLVVGKPIPIFLLLEHEIVDETSGPRLAFSIRSATVTLVSETSIRGHSPIRVQHPTGECHSEWETSKQIGSKLNYSVAIQSGGILDLRSLITDLVVPETQTPSFSTFNIVHIHNMKLKVVLMYQDRSFTASFVIKRVIVLPATHKPFPDTEQAEVLPEIQPAETSLQSAPEPEPETDAASTTKPDPDLETAPAPAPGTIAAFSTYRLRQSVDEDFDSRPPRQSSIAHNSTPLDPLSEDPPPFETAISETRPRAGTTLSTQAPDDPPAFESAPTSSRQSSRQQSLSTDEPPPFEAVSSASVSSTSRRASLARLPFDEPPSFESVVGKEELPSYAREETY